MTLFNWLYSFRVSARRQEGQTMAEYAVVLTLITLGVVGVVLILGKDIGNQLTLVANDL